MEHDYEKQAQDFLDKTKSTMGITFLCHAKHFPDDTEERDVYSVHLRRGRQVYQFEFGQSLAQSKSDKYGKRKRVPPPAYCVLSCLTKYNPGLFSEFCADFGYDQDSRKAEKAYRAVMDEYLNLSRMFSEDELEEMGEIQ